MTHDQLIAGILAEADQIGLYTLYVPDSRRVQGVPGFLDLFFAGSCGVMFREVKTGGQALSEAQLRWLKALRASRQNVAVWREADWPDQICGELRAIR